MRLTGLGSGSGGNATLIEAGRGADTTRILVDCGFSQRELCARLARAGCDIESVDALFVTHEHGDHVGCAVALARRHRIPLWTSHGTWLAIGSPAVDGLLHLARDGEPFEVGALAVHPYAVPHDAREPLQLCLTDGRATVGVLTDCGSITPALVARLQRLHALVLECNHDVDLLAESPYPPRLRARIAGPRGHLGNHTAAEMLAACLHGGLRHVVAAHLSQQNNRPELARAALARACGAHPGEILVADQALGFRWLSV